MEGDIGVRRLSVTTPPARSVAGFSTRSDDPKNAPDDEADNCRICRGEGTTEQPLFYPCKCSGSIRFVHQDCLMEWLAHSQKKYCELCKTPFTFTKLYDNTMPSTLPLALFLQQVVIHSVSALLRNTRYVVVTLVWLCWLPWSIRQVWRGLFWLADGSWVTKAQLQEAALSELAAVIEKDPNSTPSSLNSTLQTAAEVISSQMQMQTSLFSGFFGLFTGDFLLVELAKLIFPSLGHWSQDLVSSDAADDPVILLTMDRQPSLLSNVGFINSLTKYRLLNGALIDVLEGQLICLLIVIAFILVFLIREWVINQQPIANMPDPENAVDAAGPGNAQEDAARAVRRRRRARRRAEEQQDMPNAPGPRAQLLGARPIAAPRRRRGQNLDTMDPAQDLQIPEAQNLPANLAEAQISTPASPDSTPSEAGSADSSGWIDDDEPNDARPPLPARGTFDNIANIQRSIEEGSVELTESPSRMDELTSGDEHPTEFSNADIGNADADGDSQKVAPIFSPTDPNMTVTNEHREDAGPDEQAYRYSQLTPDLLHAPPEFERFNTSNAATEFFEAESGQRPGIEEGQTYPLGENAVADGDVDNSSTGDTESTNSIAANAPGTPTEESNTNSGRPTEALVQSERTFLDKTVDWFWHLDEDVQGRPAVTEPEVPQDDELLIEDTAAEAPFVPVHNREPELVEMPAFEGPPPLPPPVQEPNLLFGVDMNNPDAMEDAEDLDGILELIGMQGPLAGMVQNVIFSEFLITLTIAASIWLPYIWGKIALLVIANPVGVFVRAPLFLTSKFADFALDLAIFVTGLLTLTITSSVKTLSSLAGKRFDQWHVPEVVNSISSNMTRASGIRLEDTLSRALIGLRPDLPTFSLRSHQALRVIENQAQSLWDSIHVLLASWIQYPVQFKHTVLESALEQQGILQHAADFMTAFPKRMAALLLHTSSYVRESITRFNHSSPLQNQAIDISLAQWNAQDKLLAIVLGYLFFACIGYTYLSIARFIFGLRSEDKVEGIVADSLRQAGGVVKVVLIIGIEMIVFPLYCGLLLDAALMPLFEGVTLETRIAFMLRAPITGLFVHWFIGTCYMFHFALFVSMCRKIFRKGVLYFIRDPDDPTFHPVRDVLERPVLTQLGKIAFSGFIYGGLVYLCLGGVVYILSCISGVLPIHWSTNQPQLALPVDIIFYNFLLPFILRKTRPSKKVAAMYGWWFRSCAHALRLTNFLFAEERPEEKGTHTSQSIWSKAFSKGPGSPAFSGNSEKDMLTAHSSAADDFIRDGGYVRAPASDSVRIPKGHKVFLEVNEKNERIDGEDDKEMGIHGSKDSRFTHVYVPPNFRARITTFIVLLWLFAAATGVAFTIGPLLLGRLIIKPLAADGIAPNDLYALTVGLHVGGALLYAIAYYGRARTWIKEHTVTFRARLSFYLYPTAKYLLGLLYLVAATCILPVMFSLLAELYIHVPLYEYLSSDFKPQQLYESNTSYFMTLPPMVFLLQTWTVGLVLVRVILREAVGNPASSQPARAIKAIVRRGYLDPDVQLATRALFVPAMLLATVLWLAPLALGRMLILLFDVGDARHRATIYRYSYPGLAVMVVTIYLLLATKRRITAWRTKIRDEVYLIGERLHNYQETRQSAGNAKRKSNPKLRSERVEVE